jgi:hypothetical protein
MRYKIGDELFMIKQVHDNIQIPCRCVKQYGGNCRACYGRGTIPIRRPKKWQVVCGVLPVRHIAVHTYAGEEQSIEYDNDFTIAKEKDCFLTVEEAQKECDRRNK